MDHKDYIALRDAAREQLARDTELRVAHKSGSAHGIFIGDVMAVKGIVTFVDENGVADFKAVYHDDGKMLVPYDQIIPAWITHIPPGTDAHYVIEHSMGAGLLDTKKLTIKKRDIITSFIRRKLMTEENVRNVGTVYRLTSIGLYIKKATGVW